MTTKRHKWKMVYTNGIVNNYILHVDVRGVCVEAYANETVGESCEWQVHIRTGDDVWEDTKFGAAKTLAAAKTKAEAVVEKLVDKMIAGLQRWRAKP